MKILKAIQQNRWSRSAFNHLQVEHHKVALPFEDGYVFVRAVDIIYCEGSGTYTNFHLLDNRKICAGKNINKYDILLNHVSFVRVHKSYLINVIHVIEIVNAGYIRLTGDTMIPISRRKKTDILRMFSGIKL